MVEVFVVLVCAHVFADFLLQPDWLNERKKSPGYLALHAAIHAATAYALLQDWQCWQVPVAVFLVHGAIDLGKQRVADSATAFLVDQAAHIGSLAVIAFLLNKASTVGPFDGAGFGVMVVAAGFTTTIVGAGHFIGKVTKKILDKNELELDGLENGGKLIGQLERGLIFLFVFIGQPAGIGFLVAAKSILRMEGTKDQKRAEYVLIGTLLSFSLGILLTYLTRYAMTL